MTHVISSWVTHGGYGAQCVCGATWESDDIDVISTQLAQHQGEK